MARLANAGSYESELVAFCRDAAVARVTASVEGMRPILFLFIFLGVCASISPQVKRRLGSLSLTLSLSLSLSIYLSIYLSEWGQTAPTEDEEVTEPIKREARLKEIGD